jgi:hypothetical protein
VRPGDVVVAAEDQRAPSLVELGRGQDDATGAGDRVEQRDVLARPGRLGELHVVDDRARARRLEAVDHARVQRPRERPLLAQVGERGVVDGDDEEVARRLGAADLEPRGDAALLERRQQSGGLEPERQRGGERGDGERCGEPDRDAGPHARARAR